jgi:tRNA(Ile)-lysidine synthase TilS/MesJ
MLTILLGVAVSGGVDSMALAFLAKKDLKPHDELTAFIVDHRIRSNSTEEALQVQRNLAKLRTSFLHLLGYPLTFCRNQCYYLDCRAFANI